MWNLESNRVVREINWPFPVADAIEILGFFFTPSMAFEAHAAELIRSCRIRMWALRRVAGLEWGMCTVLLTSTYKSLIQSKLSYGLSTYGPFMAPELVRMLDVQIIHRASRLAIGGEFSARNESHLLASGLLQLRTLMIRRCAVLLDAIIRNPAARIRRSLLAQYLYLRANAGSELIPAIDQNVSISLLVDWVIPAPWLAILDELLDPLTSMLNNKLLLSQTRSEATRPANLPEEVLPVLRRELLNFMEPIRRPAWPLTGPAAGFPWLWWA